MTPSDQSDKIKTQDTKGSTPHSVLRRIRLIEDAALVTFLAVMIVVAAVQILLRNIFDMGLAWGDQILRVSVLWVGLIGAVAASRDNKHITIDVLLRFLTERAKIICQAVVGFFTSCVCAALAFYAGRFVYLDFQAGMKSFGNMPAWVMELILPAGFGLMALHFMLSSVMQLEILLMKEDRS